METTTQFRAKGGEGASILASIFFASFVVSRVRSGKELQMRIASSKHIQPPQREIGAHAKHGAL